jgi:hypothetical protein
MPSNLTWWQAADYARAGVPVRRILWFNPVVWISYAPPGIFMRHEELSTIVQPPADADPALLTVKNTQFGAEEFESADWTTLPPAGLDPVTPPGTPPPADPPGAPGLPPSLPDPTLPTPTPPPTPTPTPPDSGGGSGGPGGYPPILPVPGGSPGDGGTIIISLPSVPPSGPGHGAIPKPKPVAPPPPVTLPTPSCGAETHLSISGTLTGVTAGQAWSVVGRVASLVVDLGVLYADGTLTVSCDPHPAGTGNCSVTFKAIDGPQTLRGHNLVAIGNTVD